jgi:hypothetical protein
MKNNNKLLKEKNIKWLYNKLKYWFNKDFKIPNLNRKKWWNNKKKFFWKKQKKIYYDFKKRKNLL